MERINLVYEEILKTISKEKYLVLDPKCKLKKKEEESVERHSGKQK